MLDNAFHVDISTPIPETQIEFFVLGLNNQFPKDSELEACVKDSVKKDSKILNKKNSFGWCPIFCAISGKNVNCVKILVDNGADINGKNSQGISPLSWAVIHDSLEIVELLIKKGAKVNMTNQSDELSCLHYACGFGNILMVQLLIKSGADPNAEAKSGEKPIALTTNDKIKAFILEASRKLEIKNELKNEKCSYCGKQTDGLKKCSKCHSAFYCGRDCQVADWKKHKMSCICAIISISKSQEGRKGMMLANLSINHNKQTISSNFSMEDMVKVKDLKKAVIVKIQAIEHGMEPLYCYNQDRSLVLFIDESNGDYHLIRNKIRKDGVGKHLSMTGVGMKAYFWAETSGDQLKIFVEKLASAQNW